jgi:hypothetical protein
MYTLSKKLYTTNNQMAGSCEQGINTGIPQGEEFLEHLNE